VNRIALLLLLMLSPLAAAAQQSCLCTTGCVVVSDPYNAGTGLPTACQAVIGATTITGSIVDSSTIAVSNATRCSPASPNYVPGPAGSKACSVNVPAQAANTTVTLTMTVSNSAGTSPGTSFSFQSVSALPTVPPPPGGIRVQ